MTRSADRDLTADATSVEHSRNLDRTSIEEHRIPGLILMEHAAIGIASAVLEKLHRLDLGPHPPRVEIFAGPGNNGGDGLAVARHLANAGIAVTIVDLVPPDARPPGSDAQTQREIVTRLAREPQLAIEIIEAGEALPPISDPTAALALDAIFGTGLSRPPAGVLRAAIESLNRSAVPVMAVDLPSGLDADRGVPLEIAVEAAETVTLGIPKRGFLTPGAERFTGALRCVPIGASRHLLPGGTPAFPPLPHDVHRALGADGQPTHFVIDLDGGAEGERTSEEEDLGS